MANASPLQNPIFNDDEAARRHMEAMLWPHGRVCPHCGTVDNSTELKGKSTRPGVYKCRDCAKPFSVTVGTVYERSHIPLSKWLLATHLIVSSKKGMSAHQLWRMLGFGSYRTAWFMAHRIREAMTQTGMPMGGEGQIVEADETYFGHKKTDEPTKAPERRKHSRHSNRAVVALIERGGNARVFHVEAANKETVAKIITENVHPKSRLHTDESNIYRGADAHVAKHETTKHSAGEYARGDVHSNSVEGFFGVFKRGMKGVYQHCGEQHLQRYLVEFEFRHNTRAKLGYSDGERAALAVKGAAGRRLTLRMPQNKEA